MNYEVVFDVATAGYKSWTFPAFGLIFIAIGTGLFLFRNKWPSQWKNRPNAKFTYLYLGFAVLWTSITFFSTFKEYLSLLAAEKNGSYKVVEGNITNFVPMPGTGHAMEKFCVNNACFSYSDYVVTDGFNNTTSHGGPIHEGLPVRVTYIGNKIIRLEVAR